MGGWSLCFLVVCGVFAATAGDVVVLTDANFESKTKTGEWFVEFYAPWCGHCKNLEPLWEELATALKGTGVNVAKVDATSETETAEAYQVQGYPSLKMISGDKYYEYENERKLSVLKEFAAGGWKNRVGATRTVSGPSEVIVLTDDNLDSTVKSLDAAHEDLWLVEFYAPWCGACKALHPTWEKVAVALKGQVSVAKIDATTSSAAKDRWAINGYPTIFMFSKGRQYSFKGSRTLDPLVTWAKGGFKEERSAPVPPKDTKAVKEEEADAESDVIVLKDSNFEDEVQMGFEGVWFIEFYAMWCGHCKQLKPVWEIVATELKGKVKVAKCEANANPQSSGRFGVAGFPTLVVVHQGMYYEHTGGRSLDDLKKFATEGYKTTQGGPVQWIRAGPSEAVELTDQTFEHLTQSVTGSTTGDWMVLFHTEWCRPCVALKPVWERVALKLKGTVNVAKLDVQPNPEVTSRFSVIHFPTMLLISNGQMFLYNGTREVSDIIDFAQKRGAQFATAKASPVPPVPGAAERAQIQLGWLLMEMYRMYEWNSVAALLLLGGGFVLGCILTVLGSRILFSKGSPPPKKAPKPASPKAAPASPNTGSQKKEKGTTGAAGAQKSSGGSPKAGGKKGSGKKNQ